MRDVITKASHLGQYTVRKYDADIDASYRDPAYARQASALALPALIDLCSMDIREEASVERAIARHGRAATEAQAARYLAAAGFHARYRAAETIVTAPNVMITKGITQLWTALTGGGVPRTTYRVDVVAVTNGNRTLQDEIVDIRCPY